MGRNQTAKGAKSTREIFTAALGCEDAGERGRLLDAECGGDTELREAVEDLLREATQTEDFLD